MNVKLNIDKFIILLLPVIAAILLPFLNEKVLLFSLLLMLAIFSYELLIYKHRYIYGFSGLVHLSIPSIVLISFTIFIAIPSIYVCSIHSHQSIYPYFYSIFAFYILFPMGLMLGNLLFKIDDQKLLQFKKEKFTKDPIDYVIYELLLFLFILISIIMLIYFLRVNEYPLIELIRNPGDYFRLKILREEALKTLPVTFIEKYLFNWVRSLFFPLGIISSLFLAMVYKKRKYFALFAMYFSTGIFFTLLTLEKSPAAIIVLSIMAILYLRKQKVSLKFLVLSLFFVLLIPFLIMFFMQFGKENIWEMVVVSIFLRLFVVPSEALFYYFKTFPDYHDFLFGRSSNLFSWLHSGESFNLSNYMARVVWKLPDTTGSLNVVYLGNFWADFGWFGVILSTLVVGVFIHFLYWKLLTVTDYVKNIISVAFICFFVPLFSVNFFSSNITTLFFTRGLIIVIFILFVLQLVRQQLNVLPRPQIQKN